MKKIALLAFLGVSCSKDNPEEIAQIRVYNASNIQFQSIELKPLNNPKNTKLIKNLGSNDYTKYTSYIPSEGLFSILLKANNKLYYSMNNLSAIQPNFPTGKHTLRIQLDTTAEASSVLNIQWQKD